MTMQSSAPIAPNNLLYEDDSNPRVERPTVTAGESFGDVKDLNTWCGSPLTEEEHRNLASKVATTPEAKVDLAPGKTEDEDAGISVVNGLDDIPPVLGPMPSSPEASGSFYPGLPNDVFVEKRATSPKNGSLVERVSIDINSAVTLENLTDENPAAIAKVDWLQRLHGSTAPDYDGEWEDSPSRGATVLYKQLLEDDVAAKSVTASAHNVEHQITPVVASDRRYVSRTVLKLGENLFNDLEDVHLGSPAEKPTEQAHIADLLEKDANTLEQQPFQSKASHRSTVASVAIAAQQKNGTGSFIEANSGQHHPANAHSITAPETPAVHSAGYKYAPKLPTPVGPSPMPSFSESRDRVGRNLNYSSCTQRVFPRTAAPINNPVSDGSSHTHISTMSLGNVIENEYADVTMDMLDYQMGNYGFKDYPTYHFPGTYEGAKHDTFEAATNISSAAKSFGNALGMSGVGKALWSVGAFTAKGARRAATVIGTQATMNAINLGYKETLPPYVAQWAESKNQEEERKAERKKPTYKFADEPRYKKVDPAKYVLEKNMSGMQEDLVDLDDDLDEEDWTMVNVKETTDQASQPASTCRVHGEEPPTGHQFGPPNSAYETIMTAVESSADLAAQVGRTVRGQAIALADQQRQRQLRKQRAEEWPKDARELVQSNRYERLQTIGRLTSPHYTKVYNAHGDLVYPDRPAAHETDDVFDDYDIMVLSDEELEG
ncbi:hypothetical protein SLS60_002071 [Paraconiothyrium brasiliense]|uniref:Uncharacterized protein n=1 Tax=Paraconiothyrium brasiliense TaxID=300254 RepID=A0ABR3S146_9PLEO